MTHEFRTAGSILRSTALASLGVLLIAPCALAFNPADGVDPAASSTVRLRVPGKASGYAEKPKLVFTDSTVLPASSVRYTPVENVTDPASAAPAAVQPLVLTPPPGVTPEPVAAMPAAVITPVIATAPVTTTSYIAPTPLVARAEPTPAALPEPLAEPLHAMPPAVVPVAAVAVPAAPVPAPEGLSDSTKKIFSGIPSKISTAKPASTGKLAINRMSPTVKDMDAKASKVESFDSAGLSIKVARPGLDTNFELNRAYAALMAGDTTTAIDIYKNILSTEPTNQDALFGLAATYHRTGDLEHARPYYAQLLKVNPNHREGLNNFLALASDESPQDALAELGRLEERNPDFSPIPAQEAIVLNKLGYGEQAREKMLRAIELAPDNLTYKYNLAIMLDGHGKYEDASALYRLLIDASLKGAKIPAPLDALQKRLNYITTASAQQRASGV